MFRRCFSGCVGVEVEAPGPLCGIEADLFGAFCGGAAASSKRAHAASARNGSFCFMGVIGLVYQAVTCVFRVGRAQLRFLGVLTAHSSDCAHNSDARHTVGIRFSADWAANREVEKSF